MPLSTFLNGGTISQLRGLAFLALSEQGVRGTVTYVDDGGGGGTTGYSYGGTIPCRVDPMGGGEGMMAERLSDQSTHLITVAPYTDINRNDRFRVIGRGDFDITAVRERTGEQLRFFEAKEAS